MMIETENMLLRAPEEKDLDALGVLLNDEQVAHWLGGSRSKEDILRGIANESNHWVENDFGPWVAFDKVTNTLIGRGGIRYDDVQGVQEVELFYAILPDFWGKGLATEMVLAAIDLAKKLGKIPSIVVYTLPENVASQRVFQKAGFEYEKNIVHADQDHVFYRLVVNSPEGKRQGVPSSTTCATDLGGSSMRMQSQKSPRSGLDKPSTR